MLRAAGLLHVGCERCGSHAPVGAAQRVPDCSALKPFLRVGALAGVIALLSRDAHSPEVSSFGISNSRLLLLFAERWPQYKGISKSLRFNRSPPPTHPHQNHPHHTTTSRPCVMSPRAEACGVVGMRGCTLREAQQATPYAAPAAAASGSDGSSRRAAKTPCVPSASLRQVPVSAHAPSLCRDCAQWPPRQQPLRAVRPLPAAYRTRRPS